MSQKPKSIEIAGFQALANLLISTRKLGSEDNALGSFIKVYVKYFG